MAYCVHVITTTTSKYYNIFCTLHFVPCTCSKLKKGLGKCTPVHARAHTTHTHTHTHTQRQADRQTDTHTHTHSLADLWKLEAYQYWYQCWYAYTNSSMILRTNEKAGRWQCIGINEYSYLVSEALENNLTVPLEWQFVLIYIILAMSHLSIHTQTWLMSSTRGCTHVMLTSWSSWSMLPLTNPSDSAFITKCST